MRLDELIRHTLQLKVRLQERKWRETQRLRAIVNEEDPMSMSLNQFILNFDGKQVYSGCTGNQQAGIRPQCQDLANRWSTNISNGCFPRQGNAKDIFANAPAANWTKIRNSPSNIPRAGDVVVFGARPGAPFGHVAVAMDGCTRAVLYSFEQNWSRPNRCARERHDYRYVIGWLRAR